MKLEQEMAIMINRVNTVIKGHDPDNSTPTLAMHFMEKMVKDKPEPLRLNMYKNLMLAVESKLKAAQEKE